MRRTARANHASPTYASQIRRKLRVAPAPAHPGLRLVSCARKRGAPVLIYSAGRRVHMFCFPSLPRLRRHVADCARQLGSGETWIRDRYEPEQSTPIGPYQGRSDVVKILLGDMGFAANRDAGFGSSFYDTQGRKFVTGLPAGEAFATADLYIPSRLGSPTGDQLASHRLMGLCRHPVVRHRRPPHHRFRQQCQRLWQRLRLRRRGWRPHHGL